MHAILGTQAASYEMNKLIFPGLIALIAVAAIFASLVWPKADAEVSYIPASPVQRCMNMSNALEAPEEGLWGYTILEKDLIRIKAAGFDTVRVPVRWKLFETASGLHIDPVQLIRVSQVIEQARFAGLKVILNAHHYNELNEDPDTHEPRLEAVWRKLSDYFAGAPSDLIFELINEPHTKMTTARTDALNRRLLSIVREKHPDRWVLYGTAEWGSLYGMLESNPTYDPKAIIGFHYYEPYEFTHQGASFVNPPPPTGVTWGTQKDRAALAEHFRDAAEFRDRHGMPLLLGEFGVYEDVPLNLRADWTETVRSEAEAAGFGWCYWGFASAFKSYDPSQRDWIAPMLRALIP